MSDKAIITPKATTKARSAGVSVPPVRAWVASRIAPTWRPMPPPTRRRVPRSPHPQSLVVRNPQGLSVVSVDFAGSGQIPA